MATVVGIGEAGALLDAFAVSPAAGPPGTSVHVGGTGCSPGITVSASQDYVKITSPSFTLSLNIPVAANGSWAGSFTVPSNAIAHPGLVVATCFTDRWPSLPTTYAPQRFTVTTAGAPATSTTSTTAQSTPTPPPATTPTTVAKTGPPPAGGSTPGGGTGSPGGSPTRTAVPGGSGGSDASGARGDGSVGTTGPASKNGGTGVPVGSAKSRFAQTASAAGLPDPSLGRTSGPDLGNSLWISWLVLVALVVAASSLLWWWQRRLPADSEPVPDAP